MPNSDVVPLVKQESNKRLEQDYLQYFSIAAGNIIVLQERTWVDFFCNIVSRVFLKGLVTTYRKECISINTNS